MAHPVSGHLYRFDGKRRSTWRAKYRLPEGRQVKRTIGPAWTERGRPRAGYYTKRTAEAWLRDVLDQAHAGTLPGMVRTGVTFADACSEFLRYMRRSRASVAASSSRCAGDVAFASQRVRVCGSYAGGQLTTAKSGKVRSVPLAPDVATALARLGSRERWTGDDDLVFPGVAGGYLAGSALSRRYKTALARAALRPLRSHDLRHTFGTRMIANPTSAACRSGWATPTWRRR